MMRLSSTRTRRNSPPVGAAAGASNIAGRARAELFSSLNVGVVIFLLLSFFCGLNEIGRLALKIRRRKTPREIFSAQRAFQILILAETKTIPHKKNFQVKGAKQGAKINVSFFA